MSQFALPRRAWPGHRAPGCNNKLLEVLNELWLVAEEELFGIDDGPVEVF
jgi:hypothetical protein